MAMEQKILNQNSNQNWKLKHPEKIYREEAVIIENGFVKDLHPKIMKNSKVVGEKDEDNIIVCSLIPYESSEVRDLEKWLLPESRMSTYTCAIDGQEYTILIDLDPYSMFMNDEKIEPRLSNGVESNTEEESVETDEKKTDITDSKFKLYSCNVCKEECPCTKRQRRHPFQHEWEIAYECEICGEKVKSCSSLSSHMKTHTKKLHRCTFCDKMFVCKSSVKRHMRSHGDGNKTQLDNVSAEDIKIYDAYTKVLNLPRETDSSENELEEYQDHKENEEKVSPEKGRSEEKESPEASHKVEVEASEEKKDADDKALVEQSHRIVKELNLGQAAKQEKKKKNQAKEREKRLKRRNRRKEKREISQPKERTREIPKRARKPPVRFNGATDIDEIGEALSSDEEMPSKMELGEVDGPQSTEVVAAEAKAEVDQEEEVTVEEEDDPSYIPEGGYESEPASEPEVKADSDSSFDPAEYTPKPVRKGGRKPYVCEICQNRYSRKASLKRHYLVHNVERPYVCDKCDKSFSILSYLTAHRKIHFERQLVKCKVCSKEFTRQSNLKAHMILHIDFKPFSCRVCNKRFSHTSNLRRHEILHTGLRLHMCMLCGKGFSLPSGLKEHMVVHSVVSEMHRCDLCNKDFKEYKKLRRHIDLHISEKKYVCLVCNKTFHQKTGLKRHLLTHPEGERASVGADLQALPKTHRVPVIPSPEKSKKPIIKPLSHEAIKKIVDAVDAVEGQLNMDSVAGTGFIKTEISDLDQLAESQIGLNQIQFNEFTKVEVYEADISDETHIDKVVVIESEMAEEDDTDYMVADSSGRYVVNPSDESNSQLNQSIEFAETSAQQITSNNSHSIDRGTDKSFTENNIIFRKDEAYVDHSPEKYVTGEIPDTNWIKTETQNGGLAVESHTENNGKHSNFVRFQNYQTGPNENSMTFLGYDGYDSTKNEYSGFIENQQYYSDKVVSNGFRNADALHQEPNQ